MRTGSFIFAVFWAALNFVIYFDAGFSRALMVGVNFGIAAYVVMRAILSIAQVTAPTKPTSTTAA